MESTYELHLALMNSEFPLKIKLQPQRDTGYIHWHENLEMLYFLEGDCKDLCEKIVVVHADKDTRLERILQRDGITYEQAMTRINAQKDDDYYLSQADIIIRNHPPYNIEEEILKLEELIG